MRTAQGCGRTSILTDTEDSNVVMVCSEWTDATAAEAFLSSREFQIFKGIRILLRNEPVIVLDDVRTRVTRLMRG